MVIPIRTVSAGLIRTQGAKGALALRRGRGLVEGVGRTSPGGRGLVAVPAGGDAADLLSGRMSVMSVHRPVLGGDLVAGLLEQSLHFGGGGLEGRLGLGLARRDLVDGDGDGMADLGVVGQAGAPKPDREGVTEHRVEVADGLLDLW